MKIALTDRKVAGLKPRAERYEVMDAIARGLGVRVSPSGVKVWIYKGRFPPSPHPVRRTIGEYPILSLEQARAVAREWRGMIKARKDPGQEAARQRAAAEAAREGSFASVAERYICQHVSRLADARAVELMIRGELLARWADRPIADITRADIIRMVEEIAQRAPGRARNTFAQARGLFSFATERGLLENSPAERVRVAKLIGPVGARDRVLTDDELRALWSVCDKLGIYGGLYRLLLLTGCRRSEVAEARWGEIDLDARLWTIPGERTKTNSAHAVPLSGEAIAVLEALLRHAGSDLLFTLSGRPLNDFGAAKKRADALSGVSDWVVHDLRRTVRTRLSELGVSTTVAELCLGHAQKGLHAVYDRHRYADEKRAALDALDAWAARLRTIIDPPPANVVPLRASSLFIK